MPRQLWERFYSDFLLPNRLDEYGQLLGCAAEFGYQIRSIGEHRRAAAVGEGSETKVLILRHDVDTDLPTAKAQFDIERSLGVSASYFFRLSTVDVGFMRRLDSYGSDVGYHYEELSTVARERGLRTREEVALHRSEIQSKFRANLEQVRRTVGLPLRFVAAHGDMANRYLGIYNDELLDDVLLRALDIDLNADARGAIPGVVTFTDAPYPKFWVPRDPMIALDRGDAVVQVLTHPRQWRRNVHENLFDDVDRLVQGARYWRRRRSRRASSSR